MTNAERMKIESQPMPVQAAEVRRTNMDEVALGYSAEEAALEARRCLQCPGAPCIAGCPVGVPIPRFIAKLQDADTQEEAAGEALTVISEANLLPAICGRVCPQEKQCQAKCTVGRALKDPLKAVAIGRLERFAADNGKQHDAADRGATVVECAQGACIETTFVNENCKTPVMVSTNAHCASLTTVLSVAIVGSGPAALSCAADLLKAGFRVTMYEGLHKPGGVMVYGIPEFRLPKAIVQGEIARLEAMGLRIETNMLVGQSIGLETLLEENAAVFLALGAGLPKFLDIPGENLLGVFSANEYLTRTNLMKARKPSVEGNKEKAATPIWESKKAVVIGAGNVAMDAARMALRQGAESVTIVYRRTRAESPARLEELEHAEEEGVKFAFLRSPLEICGDEDGKVASIKLQVMELGEPDSSGRRSPVSTEVLESLDCDMVIEALGNEANPLLPRLYPDLKTDRIGRIITDERLKTSMDRVYAGGDIVQGAATVILAMGDGRKAAASIIEACKKADR
jgi:glutamate synthase (NADPH/NADH) small chain